MDPLQGIIVPDSTAFYNFLGSTYSEIVEPFAVPDYEGEDSHSTGSSAQSPEPSVPKRARKAATRRDPQARREQNRNAQRAFRDRRERRMYELESRCDNLESLVKQMREANARLQQTVSSLRLENGRLRSRSNLNEPSPRSDIAKSMPATVEGLAEPIFGNPVIAPDLTAPGW